jgi:hypothetical protein
MLAHPTLEQLHALGLHGLAKGFKELEQKSEARGLEHAEWLGLLLEYETTLRRQKRFETRARAARLRHSAASRMSITTARAGSTAPCSSNSPPATGSTSAATCSSPERAGWERAGSPARSARRPAGRIYPSSTTRMPRLFTDLAIAHGDGRYARLLRTISRAKLLILDDWGPETLTPDQARDLLEIVEDRYDAGSLVITSQIPVDRWHDMIGIPTLADAILDRVIHNAYRIDLTGESLRKQRSSPEIEALLTNPDPPETSSTQILRKQAPGGRHQIGTVAGFRSV